MGYLCLCSAELPSAHYKPCCLLKPSNACVYHLCRVCKQIKQFPDWVATHSPGSGFAFVANANQIANRHPNLVHTRKPPQLVLRKRDYKSLLSSMDRQQIPRVYG